ncbi:MAG: hypothetical protein AAGC95_16975 [Pseudomonadota bacterium]
MPHCASKTIAAALAAALLAACAATGPTAYGPADDKGFGYQETKIEDNRFRITYGGSAGVPAGEVENLALRRAGELALENGYDWFRVIGGDLSSEKRGGVALGAGVGTGSYGRSSGVSVGAGGNFGAIGAKEFATARIEVLMGSGETPDEPNAYDANAIIDSLGAGGV